MDLRTAYAAFCAIVGAMIGTVLAALVILMFTVFAFIGNGLSPAAKILGYALTAIAFVLPVIAGAYVGIMWARRIEKKPEVHIASEKAKARIFLGFSIIVAIALIIISIIRLQH